MYQQISRRNDYVSTNVLTMWLFSNRHVD